jgi:hypothetical protein
MAGRGCKYTSVLPLLFWVFLFMKKDAFYFPHFSNASKDNKIRRLEKELGLEGYAIYFKLLEVLRETTGYKYPMDDIDLLADDFGTSEPKVRVVICNYGLFNVDEENNFFSIKQIYYLQPYIEKTQRARVAAQKRWDRVEGDANAMQMHSKCNADAMQIKESKVKESKLKESKLKETKEESPLVFISNDWQLLWEGWVEHKRNQFKDKYKTKQSEQIAINQLVEMAGGELETAQEIVKASVSNLWKGLFKLKTNTNATTFTGNKPSNADIYKQRREEMHRIAAEIDRQRGIRP